MKNLILLCIVTLTWLLLGCNGRSREESNWAEYLGGGERNHYSGLDQITISNVNKLEVAWEYHTRDSGQIQCNPIVVDGILYGMTASTEPFAIDAATGKEIWRHESSSNKWSSTSRGVAYWESGDDKRILYTRESFLIALNAETGAQILTFGDSGKVSLKAGLGETAREKFVISNTPGTIFEDLIIMPMRLSEGSDAAPGYVQAFNIITGKIAWVFHTIPLPGEEGYDTWPADAYKNESVGAANNWAGMAVDKKRGIVYVPVGSAAFDFFGGERVGVNLFANTLLALDARTGRKIWHYQLVHHDILDRDPPAAPNLLTVTHRGKKIDAVAQTTKQGYVFLFNRENGEPLFPIEEVAAPASDIPGEQAWPTQPRPVKPEPYARQTLTEADINPGAPNYDELVAKFKNSRTEGAFTPLSKNGTIVFPGLDGGSEWGGAAVDPDGIIYINSNEMAWHISLVEDKGEEKNNVVSPGAQIYASKCSSCHGAERKGNPASGFPSLVNLNNRLERDHVLKIIAGGKGMMPAFKTLSENDKKILLAFLYGEKAEAKQDKQEVMGEKKDNANGKVNWKISGYTKFLDREGHPAISPPWGTLNAIDLNTGEYVWKKIYGETPDLAAKGIPQTGSESYGGPVVTAGGLLFIAGTKDQKFRAYNKITGDLIWETKLPAAAFATPATYEVDGKQYVVVACGGTKLGAPKGESYVAFKLKD
jgi:quinoprotein glucose dehydrogenase